MTAPARTARAGTTISGLGHAVWVVPFVLLAEPYATFLWHQWTVSVWENGHGAMVPVIAALLGYQILSHESFEGDRPTAWGFAILVPALLLVALDAAIATQLLGVVAILLAIPGFSLLLLGPKRTRALLFPMVLLVLMLPLPAAFVNPIHLTLRRIATDLSGWALQAMGLPVLIEGFYIYQPTGVLWIANECSGFSTMYASVTVAAVLAYLSESWWNRLALLVASVPIALACNALRIVFLALLVKRPNGMALLDGPLHPASGWVTFMLAFGLLMWIADLRRWKAQ